MNTVDSPAVPPIRHWWGAFSPDAAVLMHPAAAFRTLASRPGAGGRWDAWRRPLFFAFVLGATISLDVTGTLTFRLAASTMISWSFVPIIQVAALLAVLTPDERGRTARTVDIYSTSFSVWSLWLIGVAILFAICSPAAIYIAFGWWLEVVGPILLLWSAYVDYCFFLHVAGRRPAAAMRGLLLHRLLSWVPIVLIISQPAIAPALFYFFGR